MKKIIIFFSIFAFFTGSYALCACSLKSIQTGAACSVTSNNINITPDKPSNINQPLPNPNKENFAVPSKTTGNVRGLGTTSPAPDNTPAGSYNANCQFGVCPPGINNKGFEK